MADYPEQDVYERLGVRKLINAEGTVTALGGCRMEPEVTAAMARASRHFVDLHELLIKSGAYVAELIGVEAALITAGAAAGLALATAACIAGDDPAYVQRLPDAEGKPTRVAIHRCHRNGYDQAVRQVGAELVEFGWIKETYPWQLEAAAELPPVHNLWRFARAGADLAVFSGGKDIRGPQSSGLIVGRKDLIEACTRHACPNYSIGRAMKTGKEEIIGLVVALERYLSQDREAEDAQWEAQVAHLMQRLETLRGILFINRCTARTVDLPELMMFRDGKTAAIPVEEVEWHDSFSACTHHLIDVLRDGGEPVLDGPAGKAVLQFTLAALISSREGKEARPDDVR